MVLIFVLDWRTPTQLPSEAERSQPACSQHLLCLRLTGHRSVSAWREAACTRQQPPRHQRRCANTSVPLPSGTSGCLLACFFPEFPLLPPRKKAKEKHLPGGRKAVCCCNCMLARACWYWKIPVLKTAVAPLVFSSAGLFGNGGSTA